MPAFLRSGESLSKGQSMVAAAGRAKLILQADGNLVLLHDGVPVWAVPGPGPTIKVVMQADGNLVCYDAADNSTWASGMSGDNGVYLILQDDGNLVLQHDIRLWATDTVAVGAAIGPDTILEPGAWLLPGAAAATPDGRYTLHMQLDGNLVFQHGGVPVWASNTSTPDSSFTVQSDGNQVVYAPNGDAPWASGVQPFLRPHLVIQGDGNLVLYGDGVDWSANALITPMDPAPVFIEDIAARFAGYDSNAVGDPAIVSIEPTGPGAHGAVDHASDLVLLLIESRLLMPLVPGHGPNDTPTLTNAIQTWCHDVNTEGMQVRAFAVDLYRGPRHQDGRTLLAVRDFLAAVKAEVPRFAGVVLLGSFPEAAILRRWMWVTPFQSADMPGASNNFQITGQQQGVAPDLRRYLQIWPEQVADNSDIVLADLSGRWRDLYRETVTVRCLKLLPQSPLPAGVPSDGYLVSAAATGASSWYLNVDAVVQDVFYVQEDSVPDPPPGDSAPLSVAFSSQRRFPELFEHGLKMTNPLSRPDIVVSRIDARGSALIPDPAVVDKLGRRYLDGSGMPQSISATAPGAWAPTLRGLLHDPAEERMLVNAYFARNHAYRTAVPATHTVASISSADFPSEAGKHLSEALGVLPGAVAGGTTGMASVRDYVAWFQRAATVRSIHAHSAPGLSCFSNPAARPFVGCQNLQPAGATYGAQDVALLNGDFGGTPYHWNTASGLISPSLERGAENAAVDWWLHRSLFLHGMRGPLGSVVIHSGCNIASADGTFTLPHYDDGYGLGRLAYSLLLFTDAVAVCGRSKTYDDAVVGTFAARAHAAHSLGAGWSGLFDAAARSKDLAKPINSASSKIAYSWLLLGDWTLPFS